jgi:hypothetical protein
MHAYASMVEACGWASGSAAATCSWGLAIPMLLQCNFTSWQDVDLRWCRACTLDPQQRRGGSDCSVHHQHHSMDWHTPNGLLVLQYAAAAVHRLSTVGFTTPLGEHVETGCCNMITHRLHAAHGCAQNQPLL